MICGTVAPKKQEGGRFYLSAEQSVVSGAEYKILFDSIEFERGNGFDTDNNRYIIQRKGKYQIILQVYIQAMDVNALSYIVIMLNGSERVSYDDKRNNYGSAKSMCLRTVCVVELNKNEYIEGILEHSGSNGKFIHKFTNYTHLEVIKLP